MRRGIFRGILVWTLLSSILLGRLSYRVEERLGNIQVCEGEGIIKDIETKTIGKSILWS